MRQHEKGRSPGVGHPAIWPSAGSPLADLLARFFTNHYSAEDTGAVVQNFVKAYGAKYKDDKGQPKIPDNPGLLACDATNLLLRAITDAGADDTAKVGDALNKIKFNAVSGHCLS